jgi:hypothetical protein
MRGQDVKTFFAAASGWPFCEPIKEFLLRLMLCSGDSENYESNDEWRTWE